MNGSSHAVKTILSQNKQSQIPDISGIKSSLKASKQRSSVSFRTTRVEVVDTLEHVMREERLGILVLPMAES
jgi:hypothetical protein